MDLDVESIVDAIANGAVSLETVDKEIADRILSKARSLGLSETKTTSDDAVAFLRQKTKELKGALSLDASIDSIYKKLRSRKSFSQRSTQDAYAKYRLKQEYGKYLPSPPGRREFLTPEWARLGYRGIYSRGMPGLSRTHEPFYQSVFDGWQTNPNVFGNLQGTELVTAQDARTLREIDLQNNANLGAGRSDDATRQFFDTNWAYRESSLPPEWMRSPIVTSEQAKQMREEDAQKAAERAKQEEIDRRYRYDMMDDFDQKMDDLTERYGGDRSKAEDVFKRQLSKELPSFFRNSKMSAKDMHSMAKSWKDAQHLPIVGHFLRHPTVSIPALLAGIGSFMKKSDESAASTMKARANIAMAGAAPKEFMLAGQTLGLSLDEIQSEYANIIGRFGSYEHLKMFTNLPPGLQRIKVAEALGLNANQMYMLDVMAGKETGEAGRAAQRKARIEDLGKFGTSPDQDLEVRFDEAVLNNPVFRPFFQRQLEISGMRAESRVRGDVDWVDKLTDREALAYLSGGIESAARRSIFGPTAIMLSDLGVSLFGDPEAQKRQEAVRASALRMMYKLENDPKIKGQRSAAMAIRTLSMFGMADDISTRGAIIDAAEEASRSGIDPTQYIINNLPSLLKQSSETIEEINDAVIESSESAVNYSSEVQSSQASSNASSGSQITISINNVDVNANNADEFIASIREVAGKALLSRETLSQFVGVI